MEHANEMSMGYLVVGAIVLLVIGFLIGKATGQNSGTSPAVKKTKDEFDAYKQKVSEHFGKTADLVDDLTQSYKNVFEHLGDSARELLDEAEVKKHIDSRKDNAITLQYGTKKTAEDVKSEVAEVKQETQDLHVNNSEQSTEQNAQQHAENVLVGDEKATENVAENLAEKAVNEIELEIKKETEELKDEVKK